MALEIFAGPIVRRATVSKVYLWIATKDSPDLEAKLFVNNIIIAYGISKSIDLREKLYIHLIEMSPSNNGRFPTDQIISYSIGVPSGNSYDYLDFEKLVITERLAYGNESWYSLEGYSQNVSSGKKPILPGFVIPSQTLKLNIAFGSCRKPHDKGGDAFVKIDALLGSTSLDIPKRPHVLYLGGDQIYADDVEGTYVLPAVINVSKQLNIIEQLPNSSTHTISYSDRTQIMKNMKFTSGEIKSHLLSFGEYVAMYGLVWNKENWRGLSLGELTDFGQALEAVRRVLANIPTYMIFDDHDVTDDWFITNKWKNEVINDKNGKRVIANAMATYFLFQGWGNDPERFNFSEVKIIIENHINIGSDKKITSPFDTYFMNWDWEFYTPTTPVSYFLNTRTKRGGYDFPPILKSQESWTSTKINIQNKNLPFVLITAGPLVTFPGIDSDQENAVRIGSMQYSLDYESWFSNKDNYKFFFEYFKNNTISKIVILSGDVHYGFSAIFSIFNKEKMLQKSGGYEIQCLQITSSALKNRAELPGGFSLALRATVPYSGKLYFLLFNNTYEIACDKQQAEKRVLSNRIERIVENSARTSYPNYSILNNEIYALEVTGPLPNDFVYKKVLDTKYPELIIELFIKSLSPKTADYIVEHNFGLVSISQNNIDYSFNNGPKFYHSI